MWLANLHDVYMTGNLMRTLMDGSPLGAVEEFDVSNRGRLERCWYRDLYVLLEAWERQPLQRTAWLRPLAPSAFDEVTAIMARSDSDERRTALRNVRDYMSHRDHREYWDAGRCAVAKVGLDFATELGIAFGRYFLLALRAQSSGK